MNNKSNLQITKDANITSVQSGSETMRMTRGLLQEYYFNCVHSWVIT